MLKPTDFLAILDILIFRYTFYYPENVNWSTFFLHKCQKLSYYTSNKIDTIKTAVITCIYAKYKQNIFVCTSIRFNYLYVGKSIKKSIYNQKNNIIKSNKFR